MLCLVIFHNLLKVKKKKNKNFDTAEEDEIHSQLCLVSGRPFKTRTSGVQSVKITYNEGPSSQPCLFGCRLSTDCTSGF